MVSLKQYVKNDVEKKRQYFQSASPEITQQNLRLLQLASLSTVGFLLLFFLLTPLIIPGWKMTPQHFGFLPSSLVLFFISSFISEAEAGEFPFCNFPVHCF